MIRTHKASGMVVWKIDRCSRSVRDFAEIISELRKYDADFVSVTESFDTSNAIGRAMLQITMVFAELERERSSERITAWHAYRRRQGKAVGDAAMPLGYYRHKEVVNGVEKSVGPFLVDEAAAAVVKGTIAVFLESGSTQTAQQYLAEHGYPRDADRCEVVAAVDAPDGDADGRRPPCAGRVAGDHRLGDARSGRCALARTAHREAGSTEVTSLDADIHRHVWRLRASDDAQPASGTGSSTAAARPVRTRVSAQRCFLSICRDHLDRHVEDWVLHMITPERWQRMRERRQSAPLPPVVDTVRLEAKLNELLEDYIEERITKPEWDAARQMLTTRLADAEAENAALADDDEEEPDLPDVADLHRAWRTDRLSTEQKRLIISAVVDSDRRRTGVPDPRPQERVGAGRGPRPDHLAVTAHVAVSDRGGVMSLWTRWIGAKWP